MLYVIGLGLNGDLTVKGMEIAKKCTVYLESYTSFLPISLSELKNILKKDIILLTRKEVEETQEFLNEAAHTDIALLVMGDPLVATTHTELVIEAQKRAIKTEIIHNSSIYSAVGETGLQIYKFGKTVTIPYPEEGYKPTSFYDTILKNREMGAHTLVLLDIQEEQNRYMNPREAMEILEHVGYTEDIICVSRLGMRDQSIVYGQLITLVKITDVWGPPPHCLIIPASLHFKETEYVEKFRWKGEHDG
ncbi:MAG: diphthine synthase [Theionarchaea archaeon]|nr:diphthine synthase [Theionarchaea archaeon]